MRTMTDDPTATTGRPPADEPAAETFEVQLGRLGEIVARLESGSLGLSESIDAYERGVGLLRRLHDELAAAEARVSVLVRIDDQGRPVLDPLADGAADDPAADSTQTAPARRGRGGRTGAARPRSLPGMDDSGAGG